MADDACPYETVQEKAVEGLIGAWGYTRATMTPQEDGSVKVEAEKDAVTWNGRLRLTAKVGPYGDVTGVEERDW